MKFTVIILRPLFFVGQVENFDSAQDLQYAAVGVKAENARIAGILGRDEAFRVDRPDIAHIVKENGRYIEDGHDLLEVEPPDYTVLGTFNEVGEYRPWFNGNIP